MKSKILFVALFAIAFAAQAQTEKGKTLIGATVSSFSSKTADAIAYSTKDQTSIGISAAHFIAKNLALGLNLSFTDSQSQVQSDYLYDIGGTYVLPKAITDTRYHAVSFGPSLRHYVNISNKLKWYNEFTASIGFGKQTTEYIGIGRTMRNGDYRSYNAALNSGIAFFPTKKIAVELGVNIASYNRSYVNNDTGSNFVDRKFSFGLNSFKPMLGVSVHF